MKDASCTSSRDEMMHFFDLEHLEHLEHLELSGNLGKTNYPDFRPCCTHTGEMIVFVGTTQGVGCTLSTHGRRDLSMAPFEGWSRTNISSKCFLFGLPMTDSLF